MRRIQKIVASAGLLLASANVLAHSGHEAFGDVLHLEYLFAAGIAGAIVLTTCGKVSERNED